MRGEGNVDANYSAFRGWPGCRAAVSGPPAWENSASRGYRLTNQFFRNYFQSALLGLGTNPLPVHTREFGQEQPASVRIHPTDEAHPPANLGLCVVWAAKRLASP